MKFLDTLRAQRLELIAEREAAIAELEAASALAVTEARNLNDEETVKYDTARARVTEVDAKVEAVDARVAELVAIEERRALADLTPVSKPIMRQDVQPAASVRYMRPAEARDNAMRVLERDGKHLGAHQIDNVDRLLRTSNHNLRGDEIARLTVATMDPSYRSAFAKMMTDQGHLINSNEAAAMEIVNELRAASSTSAAGGYGVPVLIDPTIILTSGAGSAPILNYARVETITTDAWKGVSSAGVTWSFDGEATAVSDDAATVAQPSVTVYEARGFIPFSIRIGQDYPNFEAEMVGLLAQGYLDQIAQYTMTGSGSSQPWGIFSAIDQTSASEVVTTTDGALGAVDVRKAWGALPERYRSRATWAFSVTVENQLRSFSSNGMGSEFLVDLRDSGITQLFHRPVIVTDYAPAFSTTTGATNHLVVGDFANYLIAQRAGMTLEYIPHLFDASVTNRPTGQRGYFAWARWGADSIADEAFRLLQNQ